MTPDIPHLRELMARIECEPSYNQRCFLREAIATALPELLDRLEKAEAVCVAAMVYEAAVDAELSQSVKQRRMFDTLATWRQRMLRE